MDSLRISHNFLQKLTGGNYSPDNIQAFAQFHDFIKEQREEPAKKVGLLFICLNPAYWSLAKDTIEGAKKFFLPGHNVDFLMWSDVLKPEDPNFASVKDSISNMYLSPYAGKQVKAEHMATLQGRIDNTYNRAKESAQYIFSDSRIKLFPTEARPWPAGTLYRFHMFLQQSELLKEYDYLFYADIDMKFVNYIGDEILSDLVASEHPMYSLSKRFWPPYEPNPQSASYIKRPGTIIDDNGQPRFKPLYYAGGFQGGKSSEYLEASKWCAEAIDKDENELNYRPVWNDESTWNKYLADVKQPSIVLSPSFIYPDSLIKEYYEPLWGTNYPPKLVTLTKDWSISLLTPEQIQDLNIKK